MLLVRLHLFKYRYYIERFLFPLLPCGEECYLRHAVTSHSREHSTQEETSVKRYVGDIYALGGIEAIKSKNTFSRLY